MSALERITREVSALRERARQDDIDERLTHIRFGSGDYGYDTFGLSREHVRYAAKAARLLHRYYFRSEVFGGDHLPSHGRVLLVSNHSGQLPFDGMAISIAALLDAANPRLVRSMVEHFVPTLPFVSYLFARIGQVTGTPENCRTLLRRDEAILVFPEGARGISKPFSKRYQLQEFGLGFMRLALETNTPIVPIAVIGAEEQAPALNARRLASMFGLPSLPIVPYPPFFPIVPLPVRYRIHFGAPILLRGDPDDDDAVIADKVAVVKNEIERLISDGLRQRKHIFW